jgi:hypothetical protein
MKRLYAEERERAKRAEALASIKRAIAAH